MAGYRFRRAEMRSTMTRTPKGSESPPTGASAADTAARWDRLGQELGVELPQKLVEQVAGLVHDADERVGRVLFALLFDVRLIGLIGPIRPIAKPPHKQRLIMVLGPFFEAALPQKIAVIEQELFLAGPRDADQLQLHLGTRARSNTSFGDVLPTAARGLHHLVDGAALPVEVKLGEGDGPVVPNLRHLERFQPLIPAVRLDELLHASSIGLI